MEDQHEENIKQVLLSGEKTSKAYPQWLKNPWFVLLLFFIGMFVVLFVVQPNFAKTDDKMNYTKTAMISAVVTTVVGVAAYFSSKKSSL